MKSVVSFRELELFSTTLLGQKFVSVSVKQLKDFIWKSLLVLKCYRRTEMWCWTYYWAIGVIRNHPCYLMTFNTVVFQVLTFLTVLFNTEKCGKNISWTGKLIKNTENRASNKIFFRRVCLRMADVPPTIRKLNANIFNCKLYHIMYYYMNPLCLKTTTSC